MIAAYILMASALQAEAPSAPSPPVIAGGYSAMDPRAPELRKPLKLAVRAITPQPTVRARLEAAQQQVVAGVNYRLTVKLRDGSRWQAVVWRRLDGNLEVTETPRLD